jgi:hypothetical protein
LLKRFYGVDLSSSFRLVFREEPYSVSFFPRADRYQRNLSNYHQTTMKTLLRLITLWVALASANFALAQGGPPAELVTFPANATTAQKSAGVARIVALSRGANAERRQALIQEAINSDPSVASTLVAALISAFPSDSPGLTGLVVASLLSNTSISTTVKSSILTAVAQTAVEAALFIPATAVSNLVDTVNAVKNALANVAPAFQQDVASFVIPLAPGTEIQQGNPVTVVIQTPETQIIISNDNP